MDQEPGYEEIEEYGDYGISSQDAPVPRWLIASYIFWPIFGLIWLFYFWNGSHGWLDRGYWQQLQRAANTTYPFNTTVKMTEEESIKTQVVP